MALLFIDSFDHYASAEMSQKYDATISGTMIVGAYGRNGTQGLRFSATSSYSNLGMAKSVPAGDKFIAGFAFKWDAWAESSGSPIFSLWEGTTAHVDLRLNASGELFFTRNGTQIGTKYAISQSDYHFLEPKVLIADSGGTVELRVDGVTRISGTSLDTRNGGTGNVDRVVLGPTGNTANAVHLAYWDDYYICDDSGSVNNDFLGDCRVEVILPTGAGATTAWTPSAGSNYECVDETLTNGDTDYVSTDVADEVDTYAMSDLGAVAGVVLGLQTIIACRKDDGGSRSVAPVLRPASTDRIGTTQPVLDGYKMLLEIEELNPEDSAAWEIADVNGLEYGVKLIA